MSSTKRHTLTLTAGAAIGAHELVMISSAWTGVKTASANDPGIGYTDKAVASGDKFTVQLLKPAYDLVAGATLDVGDVCSPGANGRLQKATTPTRPLFVIVGLPSGKTGSAAAGDYVVAAGL